MTTAAFVTAECIVSDELTHSDEVVQTDSLVQLDVHAFLVTGDEEVGIELLADFLHLGDTLLQAFSCTGHTYVVPHDAAELLVDRVNRTLTLDVHQLVNLSLDSLLGLDELGQILREAGNSNLVGQIVLDSIRKHEVTVGQSLHEGRSTKAVSTVVREVTLADGEESLHRCLQFIVNPNTTHRIVDSGINHHRVVVVATVGRGTLFTGVHVGNLLIHVEEVAITLTDDVDTQTLDSLREVEEHSQTSVVHTEAGIATLLGCTAGHVTGNQVTEGRITALQVVVAVFLGNLPSFLGTGLQSLGIFHLLGNPDTAVVTQRL